MRILVKLIVSAAIVVAAYFAIVQVAKEKANALAGGGTFVLGPGSLEEWRSFEALLARLRDWGEGELAGTLVRWQEAGNLKVAPDLAPGRSAVFVSSLGLVQTIFVRREELVPRELPFPGLQVPDEAQLTFARIRLAGTLYHELQHATGLADEAATYEREIAWYEGLGDRVMDGLEGQERHWFEWAVESAVETALVAREKAAAAGSDDP